MKLSDLVQKLQLETGSLFGGAMTVKRGFMKEGSPVFEIRLPYKNSHFLIPKRAMEVFLAKDLFELPGSNYNISIENPVTRGVAIFCSTYENASQKDFEEYGREVLLEGLKCSKFSMASISDPMCLYVLLKQSQVFRDDLGQEGLKQVCLFLRKYGRLPYPNENLEKPESFCLFKERIEVPIGTWVKIPGCHEEKILVVGGKQNNIPIKEKIYFAPAWKTQNIDSKTKTNWIHKVSIMDVKNCITAGVSEKLLTFLAAVEPDIFSGIKMKFFADILKKTYMSKPGEIDIKFIKKNKTIEFIFEDFSRQFYAKGFMPFLLATGRFPTREELVHFKGSQENRFQQEMEK